MLNLTVNLVGKARRATLHGREYLVAPAVMIVPGVLDGSKGPLLYELEEIRNSTPRWNYIPITYNHPFDEQGQAISARSPGVLDKIGLGVVLNSHTNGKLRAETWFDVEITRSIDPRIIDRLIKGDPIELSTGLGSSTIPASKGALHNGVPYKGIAKEFEPDHLAVLVDGVGACGLRDGCGVLVNEKGKSVIKNASLYGATGPGPRDGHVHSVVLNTAGDGNTTTEDGHNHQIVNFVVQEADGHTHTLIRDGLVENQNDLSHEQMRNALETLLRKRFTQDEPTAYVENVFDDFVIFSQFDKLMKMKFNRDGDEVSLSDEDPVPVVRKTSFVALTGEDDLEKEEEMAKMTDNEKKTLVDGLIANCPCWAEADRDVLNKFDDAKLTAIKKHVEDEASKDRILNAAKQGFKAGNDQYVLNDKGEWEKKEGKKEEKKKDSVVNEEKKPQTDEDWLASAPPKIQSAVRNAMAIEAGEKEQLINQLTVNTPAAKKEAVLNRLNRMDLETLRDLSAVAPKEEEKPRTVNYLGASVPSRGHTVPDDDPDDVLPLPTVNWKEAASEVM